MEDPLTFGTIMAMPIITVKNIDELKETLKGLSDLEIADTYPTSFSMSYEEINFDVELELIRATRTAPGKVVLVGLPYKSPLLEYLDVLEVANFGVAKHIEWIDPKADCSGIVIKLKDSYHATS
jgi:hypothetical protein